jgi:hypothetical protein
MMGGRVLFRDVRLEAVRNDRLRLTDVRAAGLASEAPTWSAASDWHRWRS